MQSKLLTKRNVAAIGEEITHEMAKTKIKAYSEAHPADPRCFLIGKEIIQKILAQPNCEGIQFYNALYEDGTKTLVYVGVDKEGKAIVTIPVINNLGALDDVDGITGNRPIGPQSDDTWWLID